MLTILLIFPLTLSAQTEEREANSLQQVVTINSSPNRVALLELYTSEGCSSCPPAERFLNNLKSEGISEQQVIALAFHVTYWDYIGWKDRFARPQFDERQRELARKNNQRTVYTPQFVLLGDDYRRASNFSRDVNKIVAEEAEIKLSLTVDAQPDGMHLQLASEISLSEVKDVAIYLAVVEDNLSSDVTDGENEGERLQHNYVVRQLTLLYIHSKPVDKFEKALLISLEPDWKNEDLSVVAFAENPHTGEILQAVKYVHRDK